MDGHAVEEAGLRPVSARPLPAAVSAVARAEYFLPLCIFLVSHVSLLVLAHAAPDILQLLHRYHTYLPRTDPLARAWTWTSPWFRFDAYWYVDVAEHGYRYGAVPVTNTNFFPLFPLCIRALQPLTLGSPWIAAWLVANLFSLGSLLLLWHWARERWDQSIALRVLLLTAAFPFAFFFMAPYSESVFLALALAAFILADANRWPAAAVLAGLSAVSRPVGVVVVVSLVIMALYQRKPRAAAVAAAGMLPFIAFVLYLGLATGHPLGFTVNHSEAWVPPHGGILATIGSQFHTQLSPFDRADAAVSVLFLLSVIPVWRRLGPAYAAFVLLGVLLPLSRGLVSMERYVIVLFPAMAVWATWRSRAVQIALFALCVLGLALATVMFADGYAIF